MNHELTKKQPNKRQWHFRKTSFSDITWTVVQTLPAILTENKFTNVVRKTPASILVDLVVLVKDIKDSNLPYNETQRYYVQESQIC